MRVIAGEFKGRRLETPEDNQIRPTSDKVKEAVFSMIDEYLPEAVVLDLFSGTGSLGIEALSRGARLVWFGDRSKRSLQLTLANLRRCRAEERSRLLLGDWKSVLRRVHQPVDVILLDPPYTAGLISECLNAIAEQSRLAVEGIVVTEHPATAPDIAAPGWEMIKQKRYGDTGVTIFQRLMEG